jgi:ligand-binding sensor domain-containing protein
MTSFLVRYTVGLLLFAMLAMACKHPLPVSAVVLQDKPKRDSIVKLPAGASPHTMFRCSLKDQDGNLWFGTTGAGIYKYESGDFVRYSELDGLTNTIVYQMTYDDRGKLWVATDEGIFFMEKDKFYALKMPEIKHTVSGNPAQLQMEAHKTRWQVYCLTWDKRGNLWFGTEKEGLWCYDGNKFTNYRFINSAFVVVADTMTKVPRQAFIHALCADPDGRVWMSGYDAPFAYLENGELHQVNVDHLKQAPHKNVKGYVSSTMHVFQMAYDANGVMWMSTRDDGLCRWDGQTITSYTQSSGLSDNSSSCICPTDDGRIWVGSLGKAGARGDGIKGLWVMENEIIKPIPSDSMRNRDVWTVIDDRDGNIWIGTKEFGLFRYDGTTFTEMSSLPQTTE